VERSARVLIVHDDEANRRVLQDVLAQQGYTVSEVPEGQPALDQVRASPNGLIVVLDEMMPGMDGLTLLQRIAAEVPGARRHAFILMTARRQTYPLSVVQVFQQLGVRVIQKPFELNTLVAAVARAANLLT
jgi:CheY-like chemotaxis protein